MLADLGFVTALTIPRHLVLQSHCFLELHSGVPALLRTFSGRNLACLAHDEPCGSQGADEWLERAMTSGRVALAGLFLRPPGSEGAFSREALTAAVSLLLACLQCPCCSRACEREAECSS